MARKALLIGSNSYGSGIDSLLVPKDDIDTFGSILENKDIARFEVVKCYEEGLQETQTAISSLFSQNADTDDLLLLYFAGHGIRDQDGGLRLALRDTNVDALEATTISASFINSLISRCPSKRKVVILDCCHAAALLNSTTNSDSTTVLSRKGPVDQAFIKSNFFKPEGGNADGTGTYILAASQSGQSAFEVIQNGKAVSAYTNFIIKGIRTGEAAPEKPEISIKDLHNYVRKNRSSLSVETDPVMSVFNAGDDIVLCVNPFEPIPLSMLDALNSDDRFARIGAVEALHEIMKNESQPSRKKLILEHWRRKLEEGDQQERDFKIREKIEKLVEFYDGPVPGPPPTWGQILKDVIDTLGSAFLRVLRGNVYAAISIAVLLLYGWNVQKHYSDTLALGAEIDWNVRTTSRLFFLQDITPVVAADVEDEIRIPLSTLPIPMSDQEFTTLITQLESETTTVRRTARDILGDGDSSVGWRLLDELAEDGNSESKDLGIIVALYKMFEKIPGFGATVLKQLRDEHVQAIARIEVSTNPAMQENYPIFERRLGLDSFSSIEELVQFRQQRTEAQFLSANYNLRPLSVEDFATTYTNIVSTRILDRIYLSHTVQPNAEMIDYNSPLSPPRGSQYLLTELADHGIDAHFYISPDGKILPGVSLDEVPHFGVLSGSTDMGPVYIELVLDGDVESASEEQRLALVAVLKALDFSFGLSSEQDIFDEDGFERNLFEGQTGPGSNIKGEEISRWYNTLERRIDFSLSQTQPGEWFVRGAMLRQTTLGALGNLQDCANEFREAVEATTGDSVSTQLWETDTHFLFTIGDAMTRSQAQAFQAAAGQIACSGPTVLDSRSNFRPIAENADLSGFRVFVHMPANGIESSVEERMRSFFESRGATVAFDDKQDMFGPGVDYRRGDRDAQLTAELVAWVLNNRDGLHEHFTDIAPREQSTISDGMTLGIWLQPSG